MPGINDIPCPPGTVPTGSGCSPAQTGPADNKTNGNQRVAGPGGAGGAGTPGEGGAGDSGPAPGPSQGTGGQVPWMDPNFGKEAAGAGGGGGGGKSGGGGAGKYGGESETAQNILDHLNKILSGEESRFGPEVMQDLYAGVISDTESARESARMGQYSDLAARGLLRSAAASGQAQRADLMAMKLRSEGLRDIRVKKVMAEWDDKIGALDRSQKWLDSTREYELGKERNQIAREQIGAQLAAASMQVSAQKELAMMQMANDKEMYEMKVNDAASNRDKCVEFCQLMGDAACAQSCF